MNNSGKSGLENLGLNLLTNYQNDDDITVAGLLDGYLTKVKFGGSEDAYENDDYETRNRWLQQIAQAIDLKIKELQFDHLVINIL